MNPATRQYVRPEPPPRSSQARRAPPGFSEQVGSAQYKRETDAIFFAIDPHSGHEGDQTLEEPIVNPSEPDRRCYKFEQDLRLADNVDLYDVTDWVRQYVGCRLCVARARNAVRIHAAYKWYEVRQRVNVVIKETAIKEGKRLASPPWEEENVDRLSVWMRESAEISEVTSS